MNKMYSVGDKVRIVNRLFGHQFNVGEIVTIGGMSMMMNLKRWFQIVPLFYERW